jgi:hypothetical protein
MVHGFRGADRPVKQTTRDIRTPADPQDFESLYDRPAKPPRDFRVRKDAGGTLCVFEFQDYSDAAERQPTVEYRAYFVAFSVAKGTEIGPLARRKAALRVGRLCGSVMASGRGEWIRTSSPDFVTTAPNGGYFMAVGANRRGVESDPTIAFPSPYNP